jgi:hypothetical protein
MVEDRVLVRRDTVGVLNLRSDVAHVVNMTMDTVVVLELNGVMGLTAQLIWFAKASNLDTSYSC